MRKPGGPLDILTRVHPQLPEGLSRSIEKNVHPRRSEMTNEGMAVQLK